jgi:hypothetical protein
MQRFSTQRPGINFIPALPRISSGVYSPPAGSTSYLGPYPTPRSLLGSYTQTQITQPLIKPLSTSVVSSNSSPDSALIETWLVRQKEIVEDLLNSPFPIIENIHQTTQLMRHCCPLIPHNDPDVCCILNPNNLSFAGLCQAQIRLLGPRGKIGVPYLVTLSDGTQLVAKSSRISSLHGTYRRDPPSAISRLQGREQEVVACLSNIPLDKLRYLGTDEFTNETLIGYLINYASAQADVPGLFLIHYWATVCGDVRKYPVTGINITEYCDLGNLIEFTTNEGGKPYRGRYRLNQGQEQSVLELVGSEFVFEIIKQIVVALHFLQKTLYFASGDLKAGNVFVKSEPINEVYLGIPLRAPFRCKIADYGKSSCVINQDKVALRFYNQSTLADIYLALQPFALNTGKTVDGTYYYIISHFLISTFYARSRHMGIPFYASFDTYLIVISMLLIREYYYTFFSVDYLRQLWDILWVEPQDSKIVQDRIYQAFSKGSALSVSDAVNVLQDVRLRCDVTQALLQHIQAIYNSH